MSEELWIGVFEEEIISTGECFSYENKICFSADAKQCSLLFNCFPLTESRWPNVSVSMTVNERRTNTLRMVGSSLFARHIRFARLSPRLNFGLIFKLY